MATFDPKCYDLAELFLSDVAHTTPDDIAELATLIQETIEDFIKDLEEDNSDE